MAYICPPLKKSETRNIEFLMILLIRMIKIEEAVYRTHTSKLIGEGIQCYDRALQIDPNYADVWNNKRVALAISLRGKLNYSKHSYY